MKMYIITDFKRQLNMIDIENGKRGLFVLNAF